MSTRIGTDSTGTWSIEYEATDDRFETYREDAHTAEVTDGGVLIFRDHVGTVVSAISPTGWTRVYPA